MTLCYSFARSYYWEKLGKGSMRSLCIIYYIYMIALLNYKSYAMPPTHLNYTYIGFCIFRVVGPLPQSLGHFLHPQKKPCTH